MWAKGGDVILVIPNPLPIWLTTSLYPNRYTMLLSAETVLNHPTYLFISNRGNREEGREGDKEGGKGTEAGERKGKGVFFFFFLIRVILRRVLTFQRSNSCFRIK